MLCQVRRHIFLVAAGVSAVVSVVALLKGLGDLSEVAVMVMLILVGLWVDKLYRKSFLKLQIVRGRKGRLILIAALSLMMLGVIGTQLGQFRHSEQLLEASRWLALASLGVFAWWAVMLANEVEANRKRDAAVSETKQGGSGGQG